MTGMAAMFGFANEYIGGAGGLQAISCPGAYHNYQLFAFFGGDSYRFISLHYENLSIGEKDNFGTEVTIGSFNEPRRRFYGLGAFSLEENEVAYRDEKLEGILDVYTLPFQNIRLGLGVRYNDVEIGSSISELSEEGLPFLVEDNQFSNVIGVGGSTVVGTRFNLVYDHRDQEFSPSRGFYGKSTLEFNDITESNGIDMVDNYWRYNLDLRQYFSTANQKLTFLIRNTWTFNSEENIPFYELSGLGGNNTMRAYDPSRFLGKNAFFGSMEMRYTLFEVKILGYPMAIEMAGFLDVGQVFGGENDADLGDELNWDPGVSIRMINRPNVGLILNFANGADGLYVTGGLGLPF